jgi:hypothetical protein
MQYPKRVENVYVERLDEELCVYDWERKEMHALNPTAALVWQQCDGQSTPAEIAARLQTELNTPQAEELVRLTLQQLQQAHLLAAGEAASTSDPQVLTRRDMLKMAGLSLVLLPAIKSIELPSALQACSPNCTFSYFVADLLPGESCNERCIDRLFVDEVLCSSQIITNGRVCLCSTILADPTQDVCWGSDPTAITELESSPRDR